MKVIIAGSREIAKLEPVMEALRLSKFGITEVVSGGAIGVDTVAIYVAGWLHLPYPTIMYAKWGKGKDRDFGAGHKRNIEMAKYADALIAVWDGRSGGTKHMIEEATQRGLEVYVHRVN